jgi:hypothetical protein
MHLVPARLLALDEVWEHEPVKISNMDASSCTSLDEGIV